MKFRGVEIPEEGLKFTVVFQEPGHGKFFNVSAVISYYEEEIGTETSLGEMAFHVYSPEFFPWEFSGHAYGDIEEDGERALEKACYDFLSNISVGPLYEFSGVKIGENK